MAFTAQKSAPRHPRFLPLRDCAGYACSLLTSEALYAVNASPGLPADDKRRTRLVVPVMVLALSTLLPSTAITLQIARAARQSRRELTRIARTSRSKRCCQGHGPPGCSGRRADIGVGGQVRVDAHRGESWPPIRERRGRRTCGGWRISACIRTPRSKVGRIHAGLSEVERAGPVRAKSDWVAPRC